MIRLAALLLLLFVSAPVFADTPLVFSRCQATTEDFTVTRTIDVNSVPTEVTKTFKYMDAYDVIPDVFNFFTKFTAPCDLIHRDAAGVETVIHDCSTSGNVVGQPTCAALDVAVHFDGDQITYAVFNGTLANFVDQVHDKTLHPQATSNGSPYMTYPNKQIISTGAHLRTHVVSTGQNFDLTPNTPGVYDSGPAYVAIKNTAPTHTRIAFTSNRSGHRSPMLFHNTQTQMGYTIFSVELDGSNMRLDSHHGRAIDQHPLQASSGDILFSSWQLVAGKPYNKGNSQITGFTTDFNLFKIWKQRPDGTLQFPSLGQHSHDAFETNNSEDYNALHNLAEMSDGTICTGNYYRRNNNALGVVTCYTPEAHGREGLNPLTADRDNAFQVTNSFNLANWATNRDSIPLLVNGFPSTILNHHNFTTRLATYGKIGFPFAMPSNKYGVVWGAGNCAVVGKLDAFVALGATAPHLSTGNGSGVVMNNNTAFGEEMLARGYGDDIPGCNMGLYELSVVPSLDPSDLVPIVNTKGGHEIYARALVPYTDIFGKTRPDEAPTPQSADLAPAAPFGMLGAASITDRETTALNGIRSDPFGWGDIFSFQGQGTDTIEYTDSDLCGVRVMVQHPNTGTPHTQINTVMLERWGILGEVYTRNKDGNGDPIMDPSGNEDTSFLLRIPANMSYSMGGIDCQGRLLNFDQSWQHVQSGEQKTCGGCHVHSRDSRITFAQSVAGQSGFVPTVFGEGQVPLLDGLDVNGDPIIRNISGYGWVPDFDTDIVPIFNSRCVACHESGGSPGAGSSPRLEAGLALDNHTVDGNGNPALGSTWFTLVQDNTQDYVPAAFEVPGEIYARPFLTRYMKSFNSRGSLLYWKAANERTDNRTDGQFADDIDFGAAHPTSITTEELGTLARWIELGASAGSQMTLDTHKPTLVLDATIDVNDHITELLVGTLDMGTGIDVGTLNVCLRNGPTCTNIAPSAQLHGVTTITLGTPISDMTQVIEASVSDVQGNTMAFTRTAEFLVDGASSGSGTPSTVAINAGGNATITQGTTFSRTVTFSDGEDTNSDGWTYSITWGGVEGDTVENGAIAAGLSSFNISRLLSTAGSVPVTVTITDDVGETAQGSFTITVDTVGGGGAGLVINTGGDAIVNEGTTFTRTISLTDGNDTGNDGWSYIVNWGGLVTENGTIPAGSTSFDVTRLMADGDARMTVDVTVTDVVGDESTGSFQLTTLNVNPRGTITSPGTATVSVPYSLTLNITDPGDDTIILQSVDWGDGTFNNETTHTYTSPCSCRITVQVVDEDGVHTAARKTVTVQ